MTKFNISLEKINAKQLNILNEDRIIFIEKVKNIFLGYYNVEIIPEGYIIILKFLGKSSDDILIQVHNGINIADKLSYGDLGKDWIKKIRKDPEETLKILEALKLVLDGKEPNDILKTTKFNNISGYSTELLLKFYKWLYIQEDLNYPNGMGRMSIENGYHYPIIWKKDTDIEILRASVIIKCKKEDVDWVKNANFDKINEKTIKFSLGENSIILNRLSWNDTYITGTRMGMKGMREDLKNYLTNFNKYNKLL